jgi:hypothetical protein
MAGIYLRNPLTYANLILVLSPKAKPMVRGNLLLIHDPRRITPVSSSRNASSRYRQPDPVDLLDASFSAFFASCARYKFLLINPEHRKQR